MPCQKFGSDFKFVRLSQRWQWHYYAVKNSDSLCWLSHVINSLEHSPTVPVLTFSGNEHSRSLPAIDNNIELESFTDVAIDERTESKAKKSKFKQK